MPVDQPHFVTGLLQHALRDAELDRQMGRAATEIDAPVKGPMRIDERDPHSAGSATRGCGSSI